MKETRTHRSVEGAEGALQRPRKGRRSTGAGEKPYDCGGESGKLESAVPHRLKRPAATPRAAGSPPTIFRSGSQRAAAVGRRVFSLLLALAVGGWLGLAFVANVVVESALLSPDGQTLDGRQVQCQVTVASNHFFIRIIPLEADVGRVLPYLGMSPWCDTNFISAFFVVGETLEHPLQLGHISIDNHPARKLDARAGHLMRVAYVNRHDLRFKWSEADWFFIPGNLVGGGRDLENGFYLPQEIALEVRYDSQFSLVIPAAIKASSPPYYYEYVDNPLLERGPRRPLGGNPKTRVLWQFSVHRWTNYHQRFYPAEFEMVRYSIIDFHRREREDLRPWIIQKARLISLTDGKEENISMFLPAQYEVNDYRFHHHLYGQPMPYAVTNRMVPHEQAPELAEILAKHKAQLDRLLGRTMESPAQRGKSHLQLLVFLLLLAPVVLVGVRHALAPRKKKSHP